MITTEQINKIECLIPGRGSQAHLLREITRLLVDAGGSLVFQHLVRATGRTQAEISDAAHGWTGLERYSGLRLAPWVRRELWLAEQAESQGAVDRFESVRESLAGCRTISTYAEALAHAYPDAVTLEPVMHPRDCPGVAL